MEKVKAYGNGSGVRRFGGWRQKVGEGEASVMAERCVQRKEKRGRSQLRPISKISVLGRGELKVVANRGLGVQMSREESGRKVKDQAWEKLKGGETQISNWLQTRTGEQGGNE